MLGKEKMLSDFFRGGGGGGVRAELTSKFGVSGVAERGVSPKFLMLKVLKWNVNFH